MIGQTSQTTGLFNIFNSLGLVESGSSRYDLDELEENDDQIEYRAFANYDFGAHRISALKRYALETFSRFPLCLMRRAPLDLNWT